MKIPCYTPAPKPVAAMPTMLKFPQTQRLKSRYLIYHSCWHSILPRILFGSSLYLCQVTIRRPVFVSLEVFAVQKVLNPHLHHGDVGFELVRQLSDHFADEVGVAECLTLSNCDMG